MKDFFRRLIANVAEPTPIHSEEATPPEGADQLISEGQALEDGGDLLGALHCYQQALQAKPGYPRALLNKGNALLALVRIDDAEASYREAVRIKPDYAEGHMNLGNLMLGQDAFAEAGRCYAEALRLRPGWPEANYGLGVALSGDGRTDEAIAAFESVLRGDPSHGKALARLAEARVRQGDTEGARGLLLDFIVREPDNVAALVSLAGIEKELGDCSAATNLYRSALGSAPRTPGLCNAYLFSLQFLPEIRADKVRAEHEQVASRFISASQVERLKTDRLPDRKLRVGYVSADFRRHSVACFFEPLLRHHDRASFDITCYFNHGQRDGITDRFESLADRWRDAAEMSDEAIAQQIVSDEIDILVDLSGHTTGNRLGVFARKPAPLQFTWLGYLGTTGLASIDYRVCDGHTDPIGLAENWQVESPARMPDSQWCYQPQVELPLASPPPMLVNGFCTFGSFNQASKLNEQVLAVWADVLNVIAGSRLKIFGIVDGLMKERILARMASRQISADRVDVVGRLTIETYFASYQDVDIALDTFPYNGATTTCDALIMGVPVATIAGERSISRGGVSLLTTLGLPEWIAPSAGEFAPMLQKLAGDPHRLAELRKDLPKRMRASVLMDGEKFARNLERIFRSAWLRDCVSVNQGKA